MAAEKILADRYLIQQQLSKSPGRGTLLALDQATQTPVVIKLLLCRSATETEDLKLFRREAETLKAIAHPAIPRYLDSFELVLSTGRGYALVQTYITGKSLRAYLQEGGTLSEPEARDMAIAVLEILQFLHQQKPPIIHRDIKPANILLSPETEAFPGTIHLIDFKSAQNFVATSAGSFTVTGTYGFTPPEQTAGRALAASDLYSLGVTLVTALTGIDPGDLPRRGQRLDFGDLTDLTIEFRNWLQRMVEPGLDRRFTSATASLDALRNPGQSLHPISQLTRPPGSSIEMVKGTKTLDIQIPGRFTRRCLHLDSARFELVDMLWGQVVRRFPAAALQDVRKLERSPHQLTLWVELQSYELAPQANLSAAELDWLAVELSNWLQIPVT
jgi:serine/threonine protein kinase